MGRALSNGGNEKAASPPVRPSSQGPACPSWAPGVPSPRGSPNTHKVRVSAFGGPAPGPWDAGPLHPLSTAMLYLGVEEGGPGARLALSTEVVPLTAAGGACCQTADLESGPTH